MSRAEIKTRSERLKSLVEAHGVDKVINITGLSVASLSNYMQTNTKKTIGKNTLKLLELQLEAKTDGPNTNLS